ncbi:hypothetical protein D3C72_1181130 [compost metagenome]
MVFLASDAARAVHAEDAHLLPLGDGQAIVVIPVQGGEHRGEELGGRVELQGVLQRHAEVLELGVRDDLVTVLVEAFEGHGLSGRQRRQGLSRVEEQLVHAEDAELAELRERQLADLVVVEPLEDRRAGELGARLGLARGLVGDRRRADGGAAAGEERDGEEAREPFLHGRGPFLAGAAGVFPLSPRDGPNLRGTSHEEVPSCVVLAARDPLGCR